MAARGRARRNQGPNFDRIDFLHKKQKMQSDASNNIFKFQPIRMKNEEATAVLKSGNFRVIYG